MDLNYDRSEWDSALEAAEFADWDSIDAGEQHGPLAQWICDQAIDHKNVARNSNRIEAAFEALTVKDETEFSPERLITVLESWRGETEDSFTRLADEWAGENSYVLVGLTSEDEFEKWYTANCIPEGTVCVETSAGGTLYWFDTNKW